ncbi:MAG: hypothetical protein COT74_01775 [Bdellovibrionales bacterium CG10_big_fil_rev_8_21_14_0_10_45_34]|nr:MAG: hypothetical protein COT74_01775 [Bdellovibrionales bacterium CG10_big_fil_rev_8_21_14_0_10_45_34]
MKKQSEVSMYDPRIDRLQCILCKESADLFFTDERTRQSYLHCICCDLRFLNPSFRLDPLDEKDRYLTHNNDVNDSRYQNFVSPLYQLIKANIHSTSTGLDYGCGTGPVLTHLLSADGYDIALYDPYFMPDQSVLDAKYDFIFAVEVAEHFFDPASELLRLKELLKSGGNLMFMTLIYSADIDFGSWYYRRDPTHVCFYSEHTFNWIKEQHGFKSFKNFGNRIAWLYSP